MSQNPGREPGHDPSQEPGHPAGHDAAQEPRQDAGAEPRHDAGPDGKGAYAKPERPRSPVLRFLTPGPDTSTTQLRVYAGFWAVLLVLWISAQFWTSGISGFQRVLYGLLALVALTQISAAAAQLRKRR